MGPENLNNLFAICILIGRSFAFGGGLGLTSHKSRCYEWDNWVKAKIDQGHFRNVVLKYGKESQEKIDLEELGEKLNMD